MLSWSAVPLKKFFCLLSLSILIFPQQSLAVSAPVEAQGIVGFECYRTQAEVYTRGAELAQDFPMLAEWVDIGDSWEKSAGESSAGNDLRVLKLTNQAIQQEKPKLVLISGLHASELAPVELSLRFSERLLQVYGLNADFTWLLDQTEIHLLLIANPDGRARVEAQAQLGLPLTWQKNTNPAGCTDPNSQGVDLSRNFPTAWNGTPTNPCAGDFPGQEAQSEPETIAIFQYLNAIFGAQETSPVNGLVINLENFGNYLAFPPFHTISPSAKQADYRILTNKLAFGSPFIVKSTEGWVEQLPVTTGTLSDTAFEGLGIPSLAIAIGNALDGGTISSCLAFENDMLEADLNLLIRAARAAVDPYSLGYGPEISALSVSPAGASIEPSRTLQGIANSNLYRYISEPGSVSSVFVSVDSPPWLPETVLMPAAAVDGEFDEPEEAFSLLFNAGQLSPGKHTLFVHASNPQRQEGLVSAVVVYASLRTFLPMLGR